MMMDVINDESIVGGVISLLIVLTSNKGLKDFMFFEKNAFYVDGILKNKQYGRLISGNFLHCNWFHVAFNVVTLLSFSRFLEQELSPWALLVIYVLSMLGGDLLSLYVHRNHGDYRAVGASGAVSGVVIASILLHPTGEIGFLMLPFHFPSWIFGVVFMLVSILGVKRQSDGIGHDAHLGGALIGAFLAIRYRPEVLQEHLWMVLAIVVPAILFIILIIRNPNVLLLDSYWGETPLAMKKAVSAKKVKLSPQEELDLLLAKIKKKGIKKLTNKERRRLKELRERL